jgi:molecular chaperone DnaK (HSP70)
MQRVRQAAEDAKCVLSGESKTVVEVDSIAVGAGGANLDMRFTITRDAFVPRIADIIDRSFPVCDEALRLAGLAPTQIDEVVLVGGTTRIPYVRQRVAQYFGRDPRADINPDEAVALGAALQGASLAAVLDGARGASAQRTMMMSPDMQMLEPPPLPPPQGYQTPAPLGRMPLKQVAQRPTVVDPILEKNPFVGAGGPDPALPGGGAASARSRPSIVQLPPVRAPVLLDVTPRALAVGTVGGWCDEVIPRNVQIPIEQSRTRTAAAASPREAEDRGDLRDQHRRHPGGARQGRSNRTAPHRPREAPGRAERRGHRGRARSHQEPPHVMETT